MSVFARIAAKYTVASTTDWNGGPRLIFDLEADALRDAATKVHCAVVNDPDRNEITEYGPDQIEAALEHLSRAACLIGHNILDYDLPLLKRLYEFVPAAGCKIVDTLIVSRLIFPHLADLDGRVAGMTKQTLGKLHGSHSIEAWSRRLGIAKVGGDIEDFSVWSAGLQARCVGDVEIDTAVWRFLKPDSYSQRAIELEHQVAPICEYITADGVPFNVEAAKELEQQLVARRAVCEAELARQFPVTKLTSRPQIAALLEARGWIPEKRTEKTRRPKIDDEVLETVASIYPEFSGLSEYWLLGRRLAQLSTGPKAWLKHVGDDGRIHGGLLHIGTPHSRAAHMNPNLAQVPNPKKGKPHGNECRALFQCDSDWMLVAADQSSLQDRGLGNYLHPFDGGAYAKAFIDGVDSHWKSATALGLVLEGTERAKENKVHTVIREGGKQFRYSFLYGCGEPKAGSVIHHVARSVLQLDSTSDLYRRFFGSTDRPDANALQHAGKKARDTFIANTPGLGRLQRKLKKYAEDHGWLPGLDGRRVPVRSLHTALNYIITSSEAIICKRWLVRVYNELHTRFRYSWDGDVVICLWVHDEIVCACRPEIADQVGEILVRHAREAGEYYGFRVPLDAEYKVSRSWAGETFDADSKPTTAPINVPASDVGEGANENEPDGGAIPPPQERPQQLLTFAAEPSNVVVLRPAGFGQEAGFEDGHSEEPEPKPNGGGETPAPNGANCASEAGGGGNGRLDGRLNGGSPAFAIGGGEAPDRAAFNGTVHGDRPVTLVLVGSEVSDRAAFSGTIEKPKSRVDSAEWAARYAARGWKPIPFARRTKGPRDDDWHKLAYDPARDFNNTNVGVQLGPVSGGLTDVDLDCTEAVTLAPHFLPQTNAIFGRKSKQRSHWLYITDDPDPEKAAIKLTDDNKKAIIELRMGGGGKGAQTVFPGSIHESEEEIEWAENGELAKSSCADLNEAIRKIAVGALLARHWPAQGRHDTCLRCGGFLARAGWEPDDIEDFMRAVQIIARVNNLSHISGGCKAAYDAATMHQKDGKGYGLPAMIEVFNDAVCKRLVVFLNYSDNGEKIEKLNEKYFVAPYGGKVRVMTFDRQLIGRSSRPREVLTCFSASDFRLLYENTRIRVSARKVVGLGEWWIQHPSRRGYEGLVFQPAAPSIIESRLNLWRGWGIEPCKGSWDLLRKHNDEILADGNEEFADYNIRWTGWMFQHPDQQAEVATAFRGMKGTGKGLWGRTLCYILGQHGIHISSHEHLAGKFNKHLLDCVYLFADEAFWPGDKAAEGTLKRIITEDTLMIEPKFFDAALHTNRLHIGMASNANWVTPASVDERRFTVSDVSDKYALSKSSKEDRKKYFVPLYQEIENGGAAAMLYDLLNMDLGDWHPRYDVPQTEALMDQKALSLKPEDQWWLELLKAGHLPGAKKDNPRRAKSCDLYEMARNTVPGLRFHSDHLLGRILHDPKKGCTECRIDGLRGSEFPPLTEARAAWDAKMPGTAWELQADWEWVAEDDDGSF